MRPLHKVVIADDSRIGLSLLEGLLEPYQVESFPAEDGQAALRLAVEHEVDLVLSDILMPRLDGFGLARRIRARSDLTQPVVLLTTALTVRADLRLEAQRAGADEVLPKPLRPAMLRSALERYFDLEPCREQPGADLEAPAPSATPPTARDQGQAAQGAPAPPPPPADPPPPAPPAPRARRATPSSDRDVDALLEEALGDLRHTR